jgi:hypothetical protein
VPHADGPARETDEHVDAPLLKSRRVLAFKTDARRQQR